MAQMKRDATGPAAAPGPLVVSQANPRYFTVASGDAAGALADIEIGLALEVAGGYLLVLLDVHVTHLRC